MSIYSGFATRNLETAYNRSVAQLIHLLQMTVLSVLKNENLSLQMFSKNYLKVFGSIKAMEQHKHLEPKFSDFCSELSFYLKPENSVLSHGQPSHSTINSDLDFHILNDVLAYDSSRLGNRPGKKSVPPIRRLVNMNEENRRMSRKSLNSHHVPRNLVSRETPSVDVRRVASVSKKKRKRIDPAQLYHDQAMSLIYTGLEDY